MQVLKYSYKSFLKIMLIAVVIASGFYLRAQLIFEWESNPDHYFVKGEPTFMDLDGYYYLQTAKEITNGTYTATDIKRAYPETALRSQHPSLLPLSLAYFSKISGVSLNWSAIFFPVVLSLFLVIPLYYFSAYWGSFATVAGSITIGILALYYASRNTLGRIDTDCLNVVFSLACAYLFMRFGTESRVRRYIYFSAGIAFYLLFLWWWDMSPAAVSILSLVPLAIALLFHYRPKKNEGYIFYIVLICSVIALLYTIGFDVISATVQSIFRQFSYISKLEESLFPNIGFSIEEQRNLSLSAIGDFATTGMVSMVFSICGLVMLCYKKRTLSLYLLPLLAIGCLGVFFAERFLIFLTPVLAIGFGFFFSEALSVANYKILPTLFYGLFLCYIILTSIFTTRANYTFFPGQIIQGMQEIKHVTPKDAVIWSWWDEGHPLVYWAERATISDGWKHGGMLTYCTALPLSTHDYQLAANFIKFYLVRGTKGINQFTQTVNKDFETGMEHLKIILAKGPAEVNNYLQSENLQFDFIKNIELPATEFFFPAQAPPVYIFLDKRMLAIQRWIHWYANWNTAKKSGGATLPTITINEVNFNNEGDLDDIRFSFNKQNGTLVIDGTFEKSIQISRVTIIKDTVTKTITYNADSIQQYTFTKRMQNIFMSNNLFTDKGIYAADFLPQKEQIVLRDSFIADSLINRLYFQKNNPPKDFFEPVDITNEDYQIWKVK